ncbi:MAG TPA: carboxylesterase/lipase family protein [Kofleriaceae bacterium]|jgi:para-nitrobenzyl esterase
MTDHVIARTRAGAVRGREQDGVRQWLGVPFAAAPIGSRRFRAPEPAEPWTGERDALHVGPVAMQSREPMLAGITPSTVISEDCLSLNVYAPARGSGHPVIVWIHGGAFVMGSGSMPLYNGSSFVERHDLVVVTINYRLGLFGFSLLGEPNVGLLDQIAALRWVQDNIAEFGGDPDRVTVMGESAGAISIAHLLTMPLAHGTFHRAILQSGAGAIEPMTRTEAEATATDVLSELGATREALADMPAERILAVQATLMAKRGLAAIAPCVDGVSVPLAPRVAAKRGEITRVPLLAGSNRDEWNLFDLMMPQTTALVETQLRGRIGARADELRATYRSWADVAGDVVFRIPMLRLVEAYPAPVYVYRFDVASPAFGGRLGAAHALELSLVWNRLANPFSALLLGGDTKPFEKVALQMHDAWSAFAKTGSPEIADLPAWPRYEAPRRATMIIDRDAARVEDDAGGEQRRLWDAILADNRVE